MVGMIVCGKVCLGIVLSCSPLSCDRVDEIPKEGIYDIEFF